MSSAEIKTSSLVSDFAPARRRPFMYPGERPEDSFMVDADSHFVNPIEVTLTDGQIDFFISRLSKDGQLKTERLDDVLHKNGTLPMADRIPVVTFGSNASPGQLVHKFEKFGETSGDKMIPTTKGTIHDATPVFVPKIGIHKYTFADLVPDNGAETEVFVNWLTPQQLEFMHTTEKAYSFCEFGTVDLHVDDQAIAVPAYLYAGDVDVYIGADGRPVRISEVGSSSSIPAMTQREFQQLLVDETFMNQDRIRSSLAGVTAVHAWIDAMHGYNDRDGKPLMRNMIGNYIADYLSRNGRTSKMSLKSVIPEASIGIKNPHNLREILDVMSKTREDAL